AFCSNRDGNWEIYVCEADGSNQTNLTKNPAWDFHPRWSPDGKRILFYSDRENKRKMGEFTDQHLFQAGPWDTSRFWSPQGGCYVEVGLYVMDADGSNIRKIETGAINGAFSPDGKRVAYEANPGAGNTGERDPAAIYIKDLETGEVRLGTPPYWGGAWKPSYSPDGRMLLCMTGHDSGYCPTIFYLGPDGWPTGKYRVLCEGGEGCHPRWAPDGKRIVYCQDTRGAILRWVSLDEKPQGPRGFLPGQDIDLGEEYKNKYIAACPTVSPCGRYIAFSQSPVYFEYKPKLEPLGYKQWSFGRQIVWQELCVMRADGKVFVQL
ncbi:MAG: hypothetical protein N3A38_17250, partial [Planctomycetota bacterium]|nr:hypothetical protein [Planctomycetota bacterium]